MYESSIITFSVLVILAVGSRGDHDELCGSQNSVDFMTDATMNIIVIKIVWFHTLCLELSATCI